MQRELRSMKTALAALVVVGVGLLPGVGTAQSRPQHPNADVPALSQEGMPNAHVAHLRTYSCGSGFSAFSFSISPDGSLSALSGKGIEHIDVALHRTGYNVCYTHPTFGPRNAFELEASGQALFGASAIVGGTCVGNRFPCEVVRTDGLIRVTRRFTGNSFVGPAIFNGTHDAVATGGNGNAIGCDTLGECGNCTNRTAHILTRVDNISGVTLTGVSYQEIIDIDVSETVGDDIFISGNNSLAAYDGVGQDGREGVLMQSLILDPLLDVFAIGATPTACSSAFGVANPTAPGDFEGRVLMGFGTLGAGGSTGGSFRIHVRQL